MENKMSGIGNRFFQRRCNVCNSNGVRKEDFVKHMESHSEELKNYRFSNDPSDCCKTLCKICGQGFPLTAMRSHTRSKHDMVITEYKTKFNQTFYDIIEKVFHRCGICQNPILMDGDSIAAHLGSNKSTHQITHKAYNEKFFIRNKNMATTAPTERKLKLPQKTPMKSRPPLTQIGNTLAPGSNPAKIVSPPTPKKMSQMLIPSHLAISIVPSVLPKSSPALPVKSISEYPQLKVKSLEELMAPVNRLNVQETKMDGKEEEYMEDEPDTDSEEERFTEDDDNVNDDPLNDSIHTAVRKVLNPVASESIQRFRSFIGQITKDGETPPSYPAIEKILEMDTSSEETILEAVMEYCDLKA